MKPRARSHFVVALTFAGVVGGAWACGASELSVPDGGYTEPLPDGQLPPFGYDTGYPSYDSGIYGYDSGYTDGTIIEDTGYPDGEYYDTSYPDGFDYDSGYYDSYPYDVEYFDVTPPADAGPPWDGSAPVTIFSASGVQPVSLAADDARVYWQNSGGTVLDCPVSGCPGNVPTLLAFNGGGYYGFGSNLESIAVGSSIAFFLTSSSGIDSCAGGGCDLAPATYWDGASGGSDSGESDGGGGFFYDVVTDSSSVYFTDSSSLYSCPIGSTCASPDVLLSVPSGSLGPLAATGGELYYVDDGPYTQSIRAIPINGGNIRVVCESSILSNTNSMVVSGGYAYFTTGYESSSIYQCPAAGSGATPAIFATDVYPYGLAGDGASVYWTNDVSGGSVGTCPIGATCTGSRSVAEGQDYPQAIAVNSSAVFWTTQTAIYSATK